MSLSDVTQPLFAHLLAEKLATRQHAAFTGCYNSSLLGISYRLHLHTATALPSGEPPTNTRAKLGGP